MNDFHSGTRSGVCFPARDRYFSKLAGVARGWYGKAEGSPFTVSPFLARLGSAPFALACLHLCSRTLDRQLRSVFSSYRATDSVVSTRSVELGQERLNKREVYCCFVVPRAAPVIDEFGGLIRGDLFCAFSHRY